jgi:hypothetical protein
LSTKPVGATNSASGPTPSGSDTPGSGGKDNAASASASSMKFLGFTLGGVALGCLLVL